MSLSQRRMSDFTASGEFEPRLLSRKVLLCEGDITITRETEFSEEIITFLEGTTWGTEDTLYEHARRAEKLRYLKDPVLAVLRERDQMLATVVIERRQVQVKGSVLSGFFFRYLASKVTFRQRRVLGKYARKLMHLIVADESEEAIFYASVEGMNYRSFNFLRKMGYLEQAAISTLGYSRFWPRNDGRMEKLATDQYFAMRNLLQEFYQEHALNHLTHIFHEGHYFIIKENNQIIAGCQAHPAAWVVKNIPGRFGGAFLKILPFIPFVRKIFNPQDFRFLTFEGLYFRPGRESVLISLFESIMHHFSLNAALVWLDAKDPLYTTLRQIGKNGIMKKFTENASIKIMVIPDKISKTNLQVIQDAPMYISTFDFI